MVVGCHLQSIVLCDCLLNGIDNSIVATACYIRIFQALLVQQLAFIRMTSYVEIPWLDRLSYAHSLHTERVSSSSGLVSACGL